MKDFNLREVSSEFILKELNSIGFDSSYMKKAAEKFRYKNIKIYNLVPAQANILKQTALIYGADCAVNREVITGKIALSDAILCGSYSQLKKISEKLKSQPFRLGILASQIEKMIKTKERKTKLVGILNITPDSFSDGGLYVNSKDAIRKFIELQEDGADIIDIGAESTRPESNFVEADEQIERLKPIFKFIQRENAKHVKISVDTRSSEVADFVLNNGADIINDVSGFEFDVKLPQIISKYNAGVVIQHSKGKPSDTPYYENIIEEVYCSLKKKIELASEYGISDIIVDPGIGFGKKREDNITILDNIENFYALDLPVMIGLSRKRVLGLQEYDNDLKDVFTLAYSYPLIKKRVDYLRVHNVRLHKTFLNSIPT